LILEGNAMPIVHISLIEGRDPDAISGCVKAVARTIHETLGAPLNSIRVIATMVPAAYWAVGDQTKNEAASPTEAVRTVDKAASE
jgi:4-oxalocrotonate tautomerase